MLVQYHKQSLITTFDPRSLSEVVACWLIRAHFNVSEWRHITSLKGVGLNQFTKLYLGALLSFEAIVCPAVHRWHTACGTALFASHGDRCSRV